MWPFRRRRDNDEPAAPSAEPVSSARPEPTAPAAPRPEAWRTLPAIQRTVGDAPHTYRTDDIGEILTSWHSPILSGEMSHQVSADAPSGVLHDMATVVHSNPVGTLPASAETHVLAEPTDDHPPARSSAPAAPSQPLTTAPDPGPAATAADPSGAPAPILDARPVASEAPPLRTVNPAPGPVPTVSRIVAPDVVPPRPVPVLALQRRADAGGPASAATSAAPTPAASPAPDAPSAAAEPAAATLTSETPLVVAPPTPPAPTAPITPAGPTLPPDAVLGPPIQPRSLQRRAGDLPLPPVTGPAPAPTASEPPSAGPQESEASAPTSSAETVPAPQPTTGDTDTDDLPSAPLAASAPPLVQRTPEGHHPGDGHDHGDGDPGDETATSEADAVAAGPEMPLQRQAAPGSPSTSAATPGATTPATAPPGPAATSTPPAAPTSRPVGLGEPLATVPSGGPSPLSGDTPARAGDATSTVDPDAGDGALPLAAPAVQRTTEAAPSVGTGEPADPESAGDAPGLAPTAAQAPTLANPSLAEAPSVLNVQPGPAVDETAAGQPADAPPLVHARASEPTAGLPAPSPVTVSTLRDTPLVLQRAIDEGPPTVLGAGAMPAVPRSATPAPPVPEGTLRSAGAGPAPSIQRTTLSPAAVPGRPPSAVLASAPAGPPATPMTLASPPRPQVVTPNWPDPAQVAIDNGIAQRMPDGSVQFTVQRSAETAGADTGGVSVRDRIAQFEGGGTRSGGGPSIVATASDAPPSAPAGGNDREALEEQAKKLWPHIKRKLTNELLSGPTGRRAKW